MSPLKFFGFLFFIYSAIYGQQIDVKNLNLIECIDQRPGEYIYIGRSYLAYFQREFFKQNIEFQAGDWELNGSLYKTSESANYNSDPDPYSFDSDSRSYMVPYSNPLIIYLRLNEVTIPPREDNKHYVVKSVTNFLINPRVINTTLDGCKIDDNTQKFNLNDDYLIKEYRSTVGNPYKFEIFRNRTDTNPIPETEWTNFILRKGESNKLYVKVTYLDNANPCHSFYEMTLKATDYSTQMDKTEFEFCGTPFVVNGPDNQSNYEWYFNGDLKSTQKEVKVDALGEWIVYFDNDLGCKSSVKINVIPEKERSRIEKVTATSNSITIIPFPNANIDSYSLDGITFQNSGTFFNQTADLISIWYITKLGCVFGPIPFDIANGFNFLSPNGDGINDTWSLRNKDFYKNAKIQIFDRYGKIVANGIVNDILPWNGKHNNFILPTGTYWFIIKDDKETLKTGYIVLKTK